MEYQSLKKLKRMDLLEMLIAQVEENERLLEKMEQLHFQLERQKILSPREAGASGSAASTQVSSRAMGRSQVFAGSAGYAGSAGLMGSAGSAAAMASRSSAVSSTSTCLTGSAGTLRSTSGMKDHHGFAAGNQDSLSSAAPYAAESPYQAASYASASQSDPYAPASQADPYAPAAENASAVKGPQTSQSAPYRSAAQTDPYAPASQVNSYAQTPSYASAAQSDPYAPASQANSYAQVPSNASASQAAPYAAVSQTDPYASESPYYVATQPAPYAAERESGRMGQPDRPREELYHPDLLREENYARQPLTFSEKEGAGMLPSFLQEMPREDREDFSRSRVQLSREAQAARPDAPRHQQNVVPLKPSQVGTRTENFAPASSAASVAAGAGTPAAARQSRVRPLPFATEPGNAAADKVNRSHA